MLSRPVHTPSAVFRAFPCSAGCLFSTRLGPHAPLTSIWRRGVANSTHENDRPWKTEEDELILRDRKRGITFSAIAGKLCRKNYEVRNRFRRHAVYLDSSILQELRHGLSESDRVLLEAIQARRTAGKREFEVANELGISNTKVNYLVRFLEKSPRVSRRWTDQDTTQLLQLRGKGIPVDAIALRLGRSGIAVSKRLLRLGLKASTNPPSPILSPHGRRRWTDLEVTKVREMYEAGQSISQIASVLGRSSWSVSSMFGNRGLERRRRAHPVPNNIIQEVLRLRDQAGLGWVEIAKRLDRTSESVRNVYRTHARTK